MESFVDRAPLKMPGFTVEKGFVKERASDKTADLKLH